MTIDQRLTIAPMHVGKSRIKKMREPYWCEYRLRVDDYRVYYDVDEPARIVSILRVLPKGTDLAPKESP